MNLFSHHLNKALAEGPLALATVVAARGSTPRVAGARQFLTPTGATLGSVGGGVAEARALELAPATLADGEPRVFEADLRGRPGDVREGVCGGAMTIWIVRLDPAADLPLARTVAAELTGGARVALSTHLRARSPLARAAEDPGAFTETLEPAPRLLIAGAGHIGRSLARLATQLEFSVLVQDDRPAWLDPTAFPPDAGLHLTLPDAIEHLAAWQGERFAALVTRGFPQDVEALNALASGPALAYLGLLGSRARVGTVLAAQRNGGGPRLPEPVLHAPIGLEIGAETPEEIAVSIAAELIRVRRRSRESAVRATS